MDGFIVVQSLKVMFESLWPHGLRHTRLLSPPLSEGACSNSSLSNCWCYPTISSSVATFSSYPQSLPASGSFPMSWLFVSGDQRYWSFSFTISPSNECSGLISFQIDCFIFLLFKGLSRATIFSSTTIWKHQFFGAQSSLWSNWHVRTWLLEKS